MELSNGVRRTLLLAQDAAKKSQHSKPDGEVTASDLLNAMEKVIKNNTRSLGDDISAEIAELVNYIEKRQLDAECLGKLAMSFPLGSTYPASALLRQAQDAAKRNSESRLTLLRLFIVIRDSDHSPGSDESLAGSTSCEAYTGDSNSLVDLAEAVVNSTKLRDYLLGLVQGQSHAVNVFANAVFNSTLHSDIEAARSSKPRCILLFAGPPGVGKTYLAELSAKYFRLPYMRFDMSTFSDKEVGLFHLIGIDKSYKSAKAGVLTTFVQENPRCILLFDEIEKSHLNIIHLFLQILDAGVLRDLYTQEDVSFRNAIIIFTTNAGQNLYMNKGGNYASFLSENVILNALQTDINPMTKAPYFPAAICSRLSTGNVIMFNHLRPNHLLNIIENVIQNFADGFYNKYRVTLTFSKDVPYALLFRYCGLSDARKISEKTRSFLADEIHKVLRLWYAGNLENETKALTNITFSVSKTDIEAEAAELFEQTGSMEILVITDEQEFEQLHENNTNIQLFNANNKADTFELIAAHDFLCVILDPAVSASSDENMHNSQRTSFNRTPMESGIFEYGNVVFRAIRERFPELPIYIYETEKAFLNEDLMISYITEGAMGKLSVLSASFNDEFENILTSLSIQEKIADMASRQKILSFETVPEISADKKTLDIRLKSLSLRQNINADDMHIVADINEHKNLTFDDVIGADEVKDEMRQMLDFIKKPQKWRATGLPLPKGILLYGPPGTGKTMLAKALAREAGVPFLSEAVSNFVKMYAGTGPASVRKLFERAREYAPSIIFIDEIDAIGRKRTGGNSQHEHEMALNALLTEMDGFHNNRKRPVLVIAATNYGGNNMELDAALLRRFDRRIFVDLPNLEERSVFLHRAVKALLPEISTKNIERIAKMSNGMSLANLESVVSLAIRNSAKHKIPFSVELLEEALEIECRGKEIENHSLRRTAIHEAGHALVSICFNKNPLYITIVSRGGNLGYVQNDTSEVTIQTRKECMEQISILLAGRAAEILFCEGGSSSVASSDLQKATHLALRLICNYGMDESFGMAVIDGGNAFSGPFADKIHDKVNSILEECLVTAKKLLIGHKDAFDSLVEKLLEKRKLNADDIQLICTL